MNINSTQQPRTLSVTETAKLIRKVLKREFPDTKFSVRSDRYAGGASIDVTWTDGPLDREVRPLVLKFAGKGFDGSIDMAYHKTHWLRPDGSVLLAHTPATEGSHGSVPAQDNLDLAPVIPEDAEMVSFGADYVFTRREISNPEEKRHEAVHWIYQNCRVENATGNPNRDKFGGHWVSDMANAIANNRKDGETLQRAYQRVYKPHWHDG